MKKIAIFVLILSCICCAAEHHNKKELQIAKTVKTTMLKTKPVDARIISIDAYSNTRDAWFNVYIRVIQNGSLDTLELFAQTKDGVETHSFVGMNSFQDCFTAGEWVIFRHKP